MDKLKPLIQHHFWILFLIVLILPVIGWIPAVKQYAAQTEAQISKIGTAFSQIPGGPQANDSWAAQLNKKAAAAEEKNADARYELWKRQAAMMTWPGTIKKDLQPKAYLEEISPIARNIYKNNYSVEVRNVWQKADSFDIKTGKGTVIFPLELMPFQEFGDLTPQSSELWDAQEDLWLMESLLKSIRKANADASLITESLVRSVKVIRLVGGTGEYPDAEPVSSGGDAGSEFFETEGPSGEFMDDGLSDPLGQFSSQFGSLGSVSFDPADEFGEEQGRYVDYKEGTVFKKRGFYLEAIIDHQRLPELLTVLSNGSWPVTITRVQMAQAGAQNAVSSLMGGMEGSDRFESSSSFESPAFSPAGPLGPSGDGTTTETTFATLAAAAEFGPQLAMVAISGVIHIYNPPENLTELHDQASAAGTAPAGTAPTEQPAAAPLGEPAVTTPVPEPGADTPATAEPVEPGDQPQPAAPSEPAAEAAGFN